MSSKLSRDPTFRLFLAFRLLMTLAMQMQSVAVAWQVYEQTHSALHLGYVGLAIFLPNLLFALPGGRAADRFPRRQIMLASVITLLCTSLALLYSIRLGQAGLTLVYFTLGLIGLARAFGGPANSAYLPQLIAKGQLAPAVALQSTFFQFGSILGPALAGWLVAIPGSSVGTIYLSCSLFFLLGILALLRLPSPAIGGGPERDLNILGGLHYVWQNKLLLGAISLDLFAVLLGGAMALLPIYAHEIMHVGAPGLGMMRSAPAVGAALMAMFLAWRPLRRQVGIKMLAAVMVFGLGTIAFGVTQSFAWSIVYLTLLGASDMVSVVIRQTLIQTHTPDAMRGRVSAVNMVFIGASNELGEFESGLSAAWLGTVPAVVIGGIGTCLIVAAWSLMFPMLRRADTLHPPD